MTDNDAREKAAKDFVRDWPNESYHKNDMASPFEAGWQAALDGPAVKALVEALTKIKDVLDEHGIAPTDMMLLAEATNAIAAFEKCRGEM